LEQKAESVITSVYETFSIFPEVTWTHGWLFEILEQIPVKMNSLVDMGCGRGVIGALVRIYRNPKRLVGIDAFRPYLDFCSRHDFYDELYQYDLRQTPLPFSDKEFDVATCIEVIEHLPKNSGVRLLNELERIAKKVVITTPNDFFPQKALDNNPFQKHLSSWSVKDFTKRGYTVKGVGYFMFSGRKIKYLSFLLSRFSYTMPTFSDILLAYKLCNEKLNEKLFQCKSKESYNKRLRH
jgi:ubiquinone/menaquinone biosynthesis C-methylase UbiE